MTRDEWKETRVEAAAKVLHQCNPDWQTYEVSDFNEEAVLALEAADAVELPEEDELVEVMCAAVWQDLHPAWDKLEEEIKRQERVEMQAVLTALRSWIAAQIEKGE